MEKPKLIEVKVLVKYLVERISIKVSSNKIKEDKVQICVRKSNLLK